MCRNFHYEKKKSKRVTRAMDCPSSLFFFFFNTNFCPRLNTLNFFPFYYAERIRGSNEVEGSRPLRMRIRHSFTLTALAKRFFHRRYKITYLSFNRNIARIRVTGRAKRKTSEIAKTSLFSIASVLGEVMMEAEK